MTDIVARARDFVMHDLDLGDADSLIVDMAKEIERLRGMMEHYEYLDDECQNAADEIARLREEIRVLKLANMNLQTGLEAKAHAPR
jgi:hypothetical protein